LLNVKTLNGMNYREALRKLQPLVEGNTRETPTSGPGSGNKAPGVIQPKPVEEPGRPQGSPTNLTTVGERARPQGSPSLQGSKSTPHARPAPGALDGPTNIPVIPIKDEMIREAPRRVYKFDEELEEEKEEENQEQKVIARIKLDELKEVRGASLASQGRLTVLQNVLNSQISDEQLQHLIQHVWGVTNVKKL